MKAYQVRVVSLFALLAAGLGASSAFAALDPIVLAEEQRNANAPALQEALVSPDASVRARAALALGRILDPRSVDDLIRLVADPSPEVQDEALFALGQYGWITKGSDDRSTRIRDVLIPGLSSPSAQVRVRAIEALGKVSRGSWIRLLLPALRDPAPEVRAEALTAISRTLYVAKREDPSQPPMAIDSDVWEASLSLLNDASPQVRRALSLLLSRTKDLAQLDAAIQLAEDPDEGVSFFGIFALGKRLDDRSKQALVGILTRPESQRRAGALEALGMLCEEGADLSQIDFGAVSQDPDFHVRAALVEALGSCENLPDSARDLFRRLSQDQSAMVRASAVNHLASKFSEESISVVRQALTDPSPAVRASAVYALEEVEDEARIELLLTAVTDAHPSVRSAALEIWALIPGAQSFSVLTRALVAESAAERFVSMEALSKRSEPSIPSLLISAYRASPEPHWEEVREGIVEVLSKFEGDEAIEGLRLALGDASSSVAALARAELEKRGVQGLPAPRPVEFPFSPWREESISGSPRIRFESVRGNFTIELDPARAPVHVATLVGLARSGFFDGTPWFRVETNWVIQGGDRDRTGWGYPGFRLRAEFHSGRFERGTVGMARASSPDSGGSQLFIVTVPAPLLDGLYTPFGRVVEGMDVVDRIEIGDDILRAVVE